ncbi:MAG TPA: alpha-hydroxyketone-type quorum-sensing autoinducer synthase [Azospirillaceae bacterium]|nr:alpha-hydroxyketone-type quorum-sensing autoinducer synthase [Azospirillaceae bacterium]
MSFPSVPPKTRPIVPPVAAIDPPLLRSRVDDFYRERVEKHGSDLYLLRGRYPGPGAIQMRTNDYLDIARDARIVAAEVAVLRRQGHGDAISRVFVHNAEDPYGQLERRIARHVGAEDAVLCASGYCANIGLVQALASPETRVYVDMRAHASLWQGIAAAGASPTPFRHNDPGYLDRLARRHGPGLVLVDALYSTDGAVCPLADMVAVAEAHGCVLVVDETHSFGAQGPAGAGLTVALGLQDRVHFRTIGLSKAVAARGGVVVGAARNMEFFRYEAFPAIFSTGVLPHEVAGFGAALDIIGTEQWRRDRLHANHAYLKAGLHDLGYNVEASGAQIIALEAGANEAVIVLRDALEERGVFGSLFCPPATPRNRALIRFTLNAGLTRAQLDAVLRACAEVRGEVGMADWPSTRRRAPAPALAAE